MQIMGHPCICRAAGKNRAIVSRQPRAVFVLWTRNCIDRPKCNCRLLYEQRYAARKFPAGVSPHETAARARRASR